MWQSTLQERELWDRYQNNVSYSNASHHHHQKFIIEDNHLTIILLLYIIYYIRI